MGKKQKITDAVLDKFWDDMQKTLDENNANIDLNNKNDVGRIRIATIHAKNCSGKRSENAFLDADVTAQFAFVDDKDFDGEHATDDEIIEHQVPGKPSKERLLEIYTAAVEGRLFVMSLPETMHAGRQLVVNAKGETEMFPDGLHPTKEMLQATPCPMKPLKPKLESAGIKNRFLAFFGNKKAKDICRETDRHNTAAMEEYRESLAAWERSQTLDKRFVTQCHNQCFCDAGYFQKALDDDTREREKRFSALFERKHKNERLLQLHTAMELSVEEAADKVKELLQNGTAAEKSEELHTNLAKIVLRQGMRNRIEKEIELGHDTARKFTDFSERSDGGEVFSEEYSEKVSADFHKYRLTEKKIDELMKTADFTSARNTERLSALCENASFRAAVDALTADDLRAFADDSRKAAQNIYTKCSAMLAESEKNRAVKENGAEPLPMADAHIRGNAPKSVDRQAAYSAGI